MLRRFLMFVSLASLLSVTGSRLGFVFAQDQAFTRDIQARGRLFPELGPGLSALKRDAAGRYYILTAPATSVLIYGADGNRLGQIPNANSRGTKIVYAADIDLDADGRLFVADRGANAVKVFNTDGSLFAALPVTAPMSIAALSGTEFAATLLRSDRLVNIFDARRSLARAFGERPAVAPKSKALLSPGRVYGDGKGQIYFVFGDLPDPTIRKYDRFGYAAYEIALPAAEFGPEQRARQWTTIAIGNVQSTPEKPMIRAVSVDAETSEVWASIGNELLHFDKDGNRRAAYLLSTKQGARIEPVVLLIEHDRILVADDPNGIFDFALPEPRHAESLAH